MASKTLIVLQDDTDGSEASETIAFGIDGAAYEIDLNEKHAKQLRSSLEKYAAKGRKVGGRRSNSRGTARIDKDQISGMRAWLQEHGHDVSSRGRIPAKLQELYNKAH
jgi:hypothetical protein